jgi:predicted nuclease with TOPRIM domain
MIKKHTAIEINYEQLKQKYDNLNDRFQKLWFENHRVKELNVQLQDKIEALQDIVRYEQDFK